MFVLRSSKKHVKTLKSAKERKKGRKSVQEPVRDDEDDFTM
jgi:hypothetical protein